MLVPAPLKLDIIVGDEGFRIYWNGNVYPSNTGYFSWERKSTGYNCIKAFCKRMRIDAEGYIKSLEAAEKFHKKS